MSQRLETLTAWILLATILPALMISSGAVVHCARADGHKAIELAHRATPCAPGDHASDPDSPALASLDAPDCDDRILAPVTTAVLRTVPATQAPVHLPAALSAEIASAANLANGDQLLILLAEHGTANPDLPRVRLAVLRL